MNEGTNECIRVLTRLLMPSASLVWLVGDVENYPPKNIHRNKITINFENLKGMITGTR